PFSFVSFGWFQPFLLAALALPLAALAAWRTRGKARLLALAAALLLAALVAPSLSALAGAVFRGSAYVVASGRPLLTDDYDHVRGGYLSYPPELLRLIFEAQPPIRNPRGAVFEVRELSFGLALLPFALYLWARAARGERRWARLLLVLFA